MRLASSSGKTAFGSINWSFGLIGNLLEADSEVPPNPKVPLAPAGDPNKKEGVSLVGVPVGVRPCSVRHCRISRCVEGLAGVLTAEKLVGVLALEKEGPQGVDAAEIDHGC